MNFCPSCAPCINAVPAAAVVVQRSGGGAGALAFATAAMGLIGWDCGGCRLPLCGPSDETVAILEDLL